MKLTKFFLVLAILGSSFSSNAQKERSVEDNLVFLIRQEEHLVQAIKTGASIRKGASPVLHAGNISVIACGELVKSLMKPTTLDILSHARANNITVYACGLSLKKFGIDRNQLPSSVTYVENGLIKVMELQKEGYLSIEL